MKTEFYNFALRFFLHLRISSYQSQYLTDYIQYNCVRDRNGIRATRPVSQQEVRKAERAVKTSYDYAANRYRGADIVYSPSEGTPNGLS